MLTNFLFFSHILDLSSESENLERAALKFPMREKLKIQVIKNLRAYICKILTLSLQKYKVVSWVVKRLLKNHHGPPWTLLLDTEYHLSLLENFRATLSKSLTLSIEKFKMWEKNEK